MRRCALPIGTRIRHVTLGLGTVHSMRNYSGSGVYCVFDADGLNRMGRFVGAGVPYGCDFANIELVERTAGEPLRYGPYKPIARPLP